MLCSMESMLHGEQKSGEKDEVQRTTGLAASLARELHKRRSS